MRRATYTQGYARNKYQAAFPELWEGLVFYADPTLGPTGLTLYDQSGNGINGQMNGMVAADAWVVGERGYAIEFDGSDDEVVIPDNAALDITTSISLSVWIRWDQYTGSNQFAISKGNPSVYSIFLVNNSTIIGEYRNGGFITLNSNVTPDFGVWYHVVWTYSKSRAEMKIYINGKETNSSNPASTISTNNNVLRIGNHQLGLPHDGQIGPASIYNIALPENRIQLMAAGATPAMLAEDVILKAPAVGIPLIMQQMDQYSGGAAL